MIKLFEIENNVVKPTEHCHMIKWLWVIQKKYPENALKIYAYIFYMACPSEILEALQNAYKMYETPTVRAYNGITTMLDNLTEYMETASVTAGRDGNINSLLRIAKEFDAIRQSYKGVAKDLEAEQQTIVRGGQNLAYDQM